MPVTGLSLVGFLSKGEARAYLRNNARLAGRMVDKTWSDAQRRAAKATPNAGRPDVQALDETAHPALTRARGNPRFAHSAPQGRTWGFASVEIAPLLAYQLQVFDDRVTGLTAADTQLDNAIEVCLPDKPEPNPCTVQLVDDRTVRLLGGGPNLKSFGIFQAEDAAQQLKVAGMIWGTSSPLLQVVEVSGLHVLNNGYHRVVRLAELGMTHVPCILLSGTWADVAMVPGGTLQPQALQVAAPPTIGHFLDGRAVKLSFRPLPADVEISWRPL